MQIVIDAGGILLVSEFLASMMNSYTAPAIMGITAGIMSWFSSGLGVVFPTLIPTVPIIADLLGGMANPVVLGSAIVIGGTFTGISPFSVTGGLILATVMTEDEEQKKTAAHEEGGQNKVFFELLIWSVITLVVVIALSITNIYGLLTALF